MLIIYLSATGISLKKIDEIKNGAEILMPWIRLLRSYVALDIYPSLECKLCLEIKKAKIKKAAHTINIVSSVIFVVENINSAVLGIIHSADLINSKMLDSRWQSRILSRRYCYSVECSNFAMRDASRIMDSKSGLKKHAIPVAVARIV